MAEQVTINVSYQKPELFKFAGVTLERYCKTCNGAGAVIDQYSIGLPFESKRCIGCGGSGKLPSSQGLDLLSFLRQYEEFYR